MTQSVRTWVNDTERRHEGSRILLFTRDDGEVARHDAVEVFGTHLDRQTVIDAVVADLVHQVARMAAAEVPAALLVVLVDQILDGLGAIFAIERLGGRLK